MTEPRISPLLKVVPDCLELLLADSSPVLSIKLIHERYKVLLRWLRSSGKAAFIVVIITSLYRCCRSALPPGGGGELYHLNVFFAPSISFFSALL